MFSVEEREGFRTLHGLGLDLGVVASLLEEGKPVAALDLLQYIRAELRKQYSTPVEE